MLERGTENKVGAGDEVEIECQGQKYIGTVLTASWYGGRDGWFIEMKSRAGRYHYWKQGPDGGKLLRHTSAPLKLQ